MLWFKIKNLVGIKKIRAAPRKYPDKQLKQNMNYDSAIIERPESEEIIKHEYRLPIPEDVVMIPQGNKAVKEEIMVRLASEFLKSKSKARMRHIRYLARMKNKGYNRISSFWLPLSKEQLALLSSWLKNQTVENLLWLVGQDLDALRKMSGNHALH